MKRIMSGSPRVAENAKVVVMAMSATPPASPSSPSMRFIAFTTPAIQSIVNGRPSQPRWSSGPNGFAMWSTRKPIQYMNAATANWTRNFFPAPEPRRSS